MSDKRALQAGTSASGLPSALALGSAEQPPSEERFRSIVLFAESPDTVSTARNMAGNALAEWGLADLTFEAKVVVSELVGNVINHAVPDRALARPGGRRRIEVILRRWPKWLFIGVGDEDSSPPTCPAGETFGPEWASNLPEAVLSNNGRGLQLVHRLVDALWWTPGESGGKVVYCRFDLGTTEGKP
ncbi:ATP-binding protein [Streptomyces mobaraensis]|uniref:ATP-binding protein n=1 Tax=Streptomyces mobaraensis TaxID=35621 RepID=UPI00332CDCF4